MRVLFRTNSMNILTSDHLKFKRTIFMNNKIHGYREYIVRVFTPIHCRYEYSILINKSYS